MKARPEVLHPCHYALRTPNRPAYIMANSGELVTYGQLEARSNQAAQLFRQLGLETGDAIAICMENNACYLELCWAAQRSGLYFTCIPTHLTAAEALYIIEDCGAGALFLGIGTAALAIDLDAALDSRVQRFAIGFEQHDYRDYRESRDIMPVDRINDEVSGTDRLYSSGTTGRPKGIHTDLSGLPIDEPQSYFALFPQLYSFSEQTVYLSPAPLYHAAPLRYNMAIQRLGGCCVIMEHFDPAQALALIERYQVTHAQWVPTMFVRMLKLPKEVRDQHDLASLQVAVHAAAPCPVPIKQQMIDWWGPIVHEYYAGSEANGYCAITSEEWLRYPGSVGRTVFGTLHICDDEGRELPAGEQGTIFFGDGNQFSYHNDPDKTAASHHPQGWSTLGDIGYVNEDGYLFLTDRKAHMIISGGVNIYPQECENLLISHPAVADCAVIGVPNEDFGEEVKAVVQLLEGIEGSAEFAAELIAFCRQQLSAVKCPRSIDFEKQLPRQANGKLYKRLLRDRYWPTSTSVIGR